MNARTGRLLLPLLLLAGAATAAAPVELPLVGAFSPLPGRELLMGCTEVTQAQWVEVMGSNPSRFRGAELPVENVSWLDCQAFITRLNAREEVVAGGIVFRLPTEEEWDFACRAGEPDEAESLDDAALAAAVAGRAWFAGNAAGRTHPVAQRAPNAWGLYDMQGNVWEWTSTQEGYDLVWKGGCWYNAAFRCLPGSRCWDRPAYRYHALGLRLVAIRR